MARTVKTPRVTSASKVKSSKKVQAKTAAKKVIPVKKIVPDNKKLVKKAAPKIAKVSKPSRNPPTTTKSITKKSVPK